jgi:hypothetical protein
MAKYKVTSKVVPYPGMAAWYFAYLDKKQAEVIKKKHQPKKRGFGSIRVKVTLGKTTWDTSIFPDRHSGSFVLPLKSAVRRAEGVDAGDTVSFTLEI